MIFLLDDVHCAFLIKGKGRRDCGVRRGAWRGKGGDGVVQATLQIKIPNAIEFCSKYYQHFCLPIIYIYLSTFQLKLFLTNLRQY